MDDPRSLRPRDLRPTKVALKRVGSWGMLAGAALVAAGSATAGRWEPAPFLMCGGLVVGLIGIVAVVVRAMTPDGRSRYPRLRRPAIPKLPAPKALERDEAALDGDGEVMPGLFALGAAGRIGYELGKRYASSGAGGDVVDEGDDGDEGDWDESGDVRDGY